MPSVVVRSSVRRLSPILVLAFAFVVSRSGVRPADANTAAPGPPAGPRRIVSLIPSLTEDLFAIGAGARVVGVSQFADYPSAARRLPVVATFASIDTERIVRLHPDLVVGLPMQAALAAGVRRAGIRVELLADDTLDDVYRTLDRLGTLVGERRNATALIRALRATTARLVKTVPRGPRPRTFVVLGVAPIYTVGDRSYIARLLELAGARNAARVDGAYARYDAESLVAAQPDAIVADAQSGIASVLDRAPWSALRAVREKRVYVLGDPSILERPGPRYNEGLAWLIARLHPHVANVGAASYRAPPVRTEPGVAAANGTP